MLDNLSFVIAEASKRLLFWMDCNKKLRHFAYMPSIKVVLFSTGVYIFQYKKIFLCICEVRFLIQNRSIPFIMLSILKKSENDKIKIKGIK